MERKLSKLKMIAISAVICSFVINGFVYWQSDIHSPFVIMRDGYKLYTRVYFPASNSSDPRPVIMLRTPYDISSKNALAVAEGWTSQGYIMVMQDIRGNHGSAGVAPFSVFKDDSDVAFDTATWICAQPWCNGKIATVGASAEAFTQIACHASGAPGVIAGMIHAGAADLYDQWIYPGGCLRKNFLDAWLPGVNGMAYYPTLLQDAEKDAYWTKMSLTMGGRYVNVNTRAVHFGGWYDCFQAGTIESFMYYDHNATSYARDHQVLVMGPWYHGGLNHTGVPEYLATLNNNTAMGYDYAFGAEQVIFHEALLGESMNWTAQPRVYYILMGDPADPLADKWHTAMDWPVACTYQNWYFHSNGTLSVSAPVTPGNKSYLYDPHNPVHTGGGRTFPVSAKNTDVPITWGAYDNRPIEDGRSDIVQFTSANLTAPVVITGKLSVTLHVASNCTDTDFAVKLLDIYPNDSREIYVADGILKARYRDGFTSAAEKLMVPWKTYDLTIDMWNMAYRFSKNHRIRVSITSSNYPEYAVNPNTSGTVGSWGPRDMGSVAHAIANNTLILGQGATPSCIVLPIIL